MLKKVKKEEVEKSESIQNYLSVLEKEEKETLRNTLIKLNKNENDKSNN